MEEIKATKGEREVTISKELGADCQGAIALFGEKVVYTNFKKAAKIAAQNIMRRYLDNGMPNEEIIAKMSGWNPGVSMERVSDPVASLLGKFASLSPEAKEGILEKLMASLNK